MEKEELKEHAPNNEDQYQAYCLECPWRGPLRATYAEAYRDGVAHGHRFEIATIIGQDD